MRRSFIYAFILILFLCSLPSQAGPRKDLIAIIFPSNVKEHLTSMTENSVLGCCFLGKFNEYTIRTFFYDAHIDSLDISQYKAKKIVERITQIKPKMVVVYSDQTFTDIAVPYLYGKVPVVFVGVHKDIVDKSGVDKKLLTGSVIDHNKVNIIENLFSSRNINISGWTILYSNDRISKTELSMLQPTLKNSTTILINNAQDLKRTLHDLNKKKPMFLVSLIHQLDDVDRINKLYRDDITKIIVQYNNKHPEISFHQDYVYNGYMLSITHRNHVGCKNESIDFGSYKIFNEELLINRNRAIELGFDDLFDQLDYIDEVI